MFALPHRIVRVRRVYTSGPAVEDDLGNVTQEAGEEGEDRVEYDGFFGTTSTTADIGEPDEPQRFQTLVAVMLEPGADVLASDDLEWDGRRWRIVGEPLLETDLQGRARHYTVNVAGYATEELVGS